MRCSAALVWASLPELPKGCQRERIQASGELSFNVFRKAEQNCRGCLKKGRSDEIWRTLPGHQFRRLQERPLRKRRS